MNERKFISLKKPDNLLKNKNPLPPFNPDNYENPYRENKTEFIQNEIEYKIIDGEIYPILKQDNNIYQKILKEASKWSRSDMAYETAVNLDDDMKNYQGCLNIFKAKADMDFNNSENWGFWAIKDVKADKIIMPFINMNISDDMVNIGNYISNQYIPYSRFYFKEVNVLGKNYQIICRNYDKIEDIEKEFMCLNYKVNNFKQFEISPNVGKIIEALIIAFLVILISPFLLFGLMSVAVFFLNMIE